MIVRMDIIMMRGTEEYWLAHSNDDSRQVIYLCHAQPGWSKRQEVPHHLDAPLGSRK